MKLRKHDGRLKIEHSILDGVRVMLTRLLADTPEIRSVIPGVIQRVRDAKGPSVKVRITVPTQNGWKAIALSDGARQELFISTTMSKPELEQALQHAASATL
ncbi:MAG TPA: DUF2103 domain-containing protein [Bryobacteraceae bacterium]|nr:DUF2103 domain-containing protein [Bryobacteraceae bacterium]